jgi:hypothetical protein
MNIEGDDTRIEDGTDDLIVPNDDMTEPGAIDEIVDDTAPFVYRENTSGIFCFGLPSYRARISPNVSVRILDFPVL